MAEVRRRDIAIVGMAALFPGAGDLHAFWRNVTGGVDAISDAPPSRLDPVFYDPDAWDAPASSDRLYCRRGGFVDELATFDPTRFGIMPVAAAGAEPDQLLALRVAAEAVADAGGDGRLPDRARVGVIIGRGGFPTPGVTRLVQRVRVAHQLTASLRELVPDLDEATLARVRTAFQERLGPERPEASIGLVPNLAASRIANRLDLRGPAYTIDAACASSLVAVDQAVGELTSGRCDAVLAGGTHHCHDVTFWSVFSQLRALSPSQRIRPFDRRADGLLIGEGTGLVVLKRLADAERDGDRVYAVIRGVGVASDGRASSLMSPRLDGQVLALERAWWQAGLDPTGDHAVGLVEAHGTATPTGDQVELATLARVFGASGSRIGIGSIKSMIGHAMPAAGIAGLIKAALAIHHGVLPPTLHCDDPHPALQGTRFQPITRTAPWERAHATGPPRRAGVNAFGFGGVDAHVVLEEAPAWSAAPNPRRRRPQRSGDVASGAGAQMRVGPRPPSGNRSAGPERLLLLSAGSAAGVARQLQADDAELLARDDTRQPPHGGPCRLALVAPTAQRLELARKVAAQGRPWRGRSDLWFTPAPLLGEHARQPAGTAFLFPGLEPDLEPDIDDVADHFGLPRPALAADRAVARRGFDIIVVGRLLDDALRALGIMPDVVAGHSVGEWSAVISAELFPHDTIEQWLDAFDPDAIELPGVVFAALGCGAAQAAEAIAGLDGVVVSHDNCPHQSLICGEESSVAAALQRLRGAGVHGQTLPFRSGFHSPMLEPHLGPLSDILAGGSPQPPAIPVWSATTLAPYPIAADEVRALLIRHLLEPVRFRSLIERLHARGTRVFVQVGGGSLTGFVDDTLRGHDHLAISAGTRQRPGLDQLRRVVAALWVEGHAPRFDRLAPVAAARPDPHPRAHQVMRLDLGAPLIRLDGAVEPVAVRDTPPARTTPGDAGDRPRATHPVLAEFDATMHDAVTAARQVLDAWDRPAADVPATGPAGTGQRTHRTTTRVLSTTTMPFLRDHCLFPQRPGWHELSDGYPVVPMTTLLDLIAGAACELVPGKTVVGIDNVRAMRWLAVAPPVTAAVNATHDSQGDVEVVIDGYLRGTVRLADDYPPPPEPSREPLTGERACEVSARQLYDDGWLFHGPAFRGVVELGPIGGDGIRGRVVTLPATGALLDGAGQLLGFWVMAAMATNRSNVPMTIGRVRFYGPHPSPGEVLDGTVWIRAETDTSIRADLELRTPGGRVWARVDGWENRRFFTDDLVWPVLRSPGTNGLAESQPGGWFLVRERARDPASRELLMRRYLGPAERDGYQELSPRRQRQWLLGRMAVKDAVRQWLWQHGEGPRWPAEICVSNDAMGRPHVTGPFAERLEVSLAHTESLAAAIVRPRHAVARHGIGIDIERVAERGSRLEAMALAHAERDTLDELGRDTAGRAAWFTRFWAAKEAVAKAEGTGLQGRPKRLAVERVDGDRLLVACAPTGRDSHGQSRWVETTLVHDATQGSPATTYAVAWTAPQDDPPTTTDREHGDGS